MGQFEKKKELKNAIGTPGNSYNGRRRPGMDLCACFTSVDAARRGLKIIENELKRYGSILSRPKTESMTLNHDEETIKSESLISLDEEKIKNVLEFKYLGVTLSPQKPTRLIEHRIASATAKFHELRKVLTNGRISVRTRGRYMNAFVRSKLFYNIATWNNPDNFV